MCPPPSRCAGISKPSLPDDADVDGRDAASVNSGEECGLDHYVALGEDFSGKRAEEAKEDW